MEEELDLLEGELELVEVELGSVEGHRAERERKLDQVWGEME